MSASRHHWDDEATLQFRMGMHWKPIGAVTLDDERRLSFPPAPKLPAIYRVRVRLRTSEFVYVGETQNLRKRFGNYRNPGPTQMTSTRINAKLIETLRAGAEISVSAVVDGAWVNFGNGRQEADFKSKAIRCLFENATIASHGGRTSKS